MGFKFPKMPLHFADAAPTVHFKAKSSVVNRRDSALAQIMKRKKSRWHFYLFTADLQRSSVPFKIKNLTVVTPPADATRMQVPR